MLAPCAQAKRKVAVTVPPPAPDTPPHPSPARKRRTRRSDSTYQVTAHVLDTLLKHEAAYLADALSSHFGLRLAPILAPFPTELPQLDLHLERLDSVFLLADGGLLHLEFQATYDRKTLLRFQSYDIALYNATNRTIHTVIIYGPGVARAPKVLYMGSNTYRVRNIFLGRRDGERVYRQVQRALDQGGPLSAGERIDLLFQPLMRQKRRTQPEVFRDALAQAGRLPGADQERAIASLLALAYHVLGEPALNSLVEDLMATNLLVKVLGEERQKGIEQGIEQGLERGVEQARRQDILRTLRRRFADVPDPVVEQVTRISDPDRLAALLDAAVDARTLDEFTGVLAQ
jgi:hypothetical protein